MSKYEQSTYGINPDQKYQSGQMRIDGKKADIGIDYASRTQSIKARDLEFDRQKFEQRKENSKNMHDGFDRKLDVIKNDRAYDRHKMQTEVAGNIEDGAKTSKRSAFNIWPGATKPEFLKSGKNKK